jgi:hypothetical protein
VPKTTWPPPSAFELLNRCAEVANGVIKPCGNFAKTRLHVRFPMARGLRVRPVCVI